MLLKNISHGLQQSYRTLNHTLIKHSESESIKKALAVAQILFGLYGLYDLRRIYLKDKEIKKSGQILTRNQKILRLIHVMGSVSLVVSALISPLSLSFLKKGIEYLSTFEAFKDFSLKNHSLASDNILYFIRIACVVSQIPLSLKRTYDFCLLTAKLIRWLKT